MKRQHGYTIIEVLVASAVLLIGIAASAALALTMAAQEEANSQVARALNIQEQAGKLYQLGLSQDEINAILPPEPNVVSLIFSASSATVNGIGTVEVADCQLIFNAGTPMTAASSVTPSQRTNDLVLVRPSIR